MIKKFLELTYQGEKALFNVENIYSIKPNKDNSTSFINLNGKIYEVSETFSEIREMLAKEGMV